MRLPRWLVITIGLLPIVLLFSLFVWGVFFKGDTSSSGIAQFNKEGEGKILQDSPTNFTLALFSGGELRLSDVQAKNKVVMVDFWASWCVPCRQEASDLETVWQRYKDKGVAFVGVAVNDSDNQSKEFIKQFGTTFPAGPDGKGTVAVSYGFTGIPEKYFIDQHGKVVKKLVGPLTVERLSGVLDELLARS